MVSDEVSLEYWSLVGGSVEDPSIVVVELEEDGADPELVNLLSEDDSEQCHAEL